jgi:hypothetical protein
LSQFTGSAPRFKVGQWVGACTHSVGYILELLQLNRGDVTLTMKPAIAVWIAEKLAVALMLTRIAATTLLYTLCPRIVTVSGARIQDRSDVWVAVLSKRNIWNRINTRDLEVVLK